MPGYPEDTKPKSPDPLVGVLIAAVICVPFWMTVMCLLMLACKCE